MLGEGGFAGRTVVVTGAGNGIGRAMVRRFASAGARVIGVDVSGQHLATVAEGMAEMEIVVGDVRDSTTIRDVLELCENGLHVLCNNAGVVGDIVLVDELAEDEWDRIIDVNLTATFLFCKHAIPIMLAQGGGVIVNTASVAGLRGGRAGPAYTASKFGLVGLTMNIAASYADRGIRCNAVCPGGVATGIAAGASYSERGRSLVGRDTGRPDRASPDEIAAVAVFLASDGASQVNGAALPVDGSWTAW